MLLPVAVFRILPCPCGVHTLIDLLLSMRTGLVIIQRYVPLLLPGFGVPIYLIQNNHSGPLVFPALLLPQEDWVALWASGLWTG